MCTISFCDKGWIYHLSLNQVFSGKLSWISQKRALKNFGWELLKIIIYKIKWYIKCAAISKMNNKLLCWSDYLFDSSQNDILLLKKAIKI